MSRPYNFSAGPGALPEPVLRRAREELLDWRGSGMSVMEMTHRGKHFARIAEQAEADLRSLLAVPDDYRVLFLQGGATLQFGAVPLNLLAPGQSADYLLTGAWSKKAFGEARRLGLARCAASSETTGFNAIPPRASWELDPAAAYLHYTPNETIGGVEYHWLPDVGEVPLVADMSSTILSRPLDVRAFGLIYAGAQKNVGPAGLTLVIARDELLGRASPTCPSVLDYRLQAEADSMYNTPCTFAWYVAGLVFAWLKERGGLAAMGQVNCRKAEALYAAIDGSSFYSNPVAADCRSWMNVPFTLADPTLDATFLAESARSGLLDLKGHRSVGGMRASIYNAMPEEGVAALVDFMADFERRYG
jgi:phosphoserine aminotransferase